MLAHFLIQKTGTGTLNREDIDLLRTGCFVFVPRPSGGVVSLIDLSRRSRLLGMALPRMLFYFSSVYRHRIVAGGVTGVHVVSSRSARVPPLPVQRGPFEIWKNALPGGIVPDVVVAQVHEPGKEHLVDFLAYRQGRTVEVRNASADVSVRWIAGHSRGRTLRLLLEDGGLEREVLPADLGGTFAYGQFHDWIRSRLSVEGAMAAAPLHPNRIPGVSFDRRSFATAAPVPRRRRRRLSSTRASDSRFAKQWPEMCFDNNAHVGQEEQPATASDASKLVEQDLRAIAKAMQPNTNMRYNNNSNDHGHGMSIMTTTTSGRVGHEMGSAEESRASVENSTYAMGPGMLHNIPQRGATLPAASNNAMLCEHSCDAWLRADTATGGAVLQHFNQHTTKAGSSAGSTFRATATQHTGHEASVRPYTNDVMSPLELSASLCDAARGTLPALDAITAMGQQAPTPQATHKPYQHKKLSVRTRMGEAPNRLFPKQCTAALPPPEHPSIPPLINAKRRRRSDPEREELQSKIDELETRNETVRQANQRLEHFIAQARYVVAVAQDRSQQGAHAAW